MVEAFFPLPLDAATCEVMIAAVTGITTTAVLVTNHFRHRQQAGIYDLESHGITYLPQEIEKRRLRNKLPSNRKNTP